MKRLLVMSDTHGEGYNLRCLLEAAWRQTGNLPIDCYVHCGDGIGDLEGCLDLIQARDPGAQLCMVRGNCDFGADAPDFAVLEMGGARIFVTHGHRYQVKYGLMNLGYAAQEQGCSIALYGHTHIPDMENGRALMINPGCTADRRMALLELEDGKPHVKLMQLVI